MPKIKTHRGAAKRFKMTASGKIKRKKSGMRHILTAKASGVKRGLRKSGLVDKTNVDAIKKMMPYA